MANGRCDIRLACGWWLHLKTRLLKKRLGAQGPLSLIALWSYAAENHRDGDLAPLTDDAIETAADWDGAAGAFVAALREIGWLDGALLHDWEEEQPWVFGSDARAKAAAALAKRRWDAARNAGRIAVGNAPSPSPSPSPSPESSSASAEESSKTQSSALPIAPTALVAEAATPPVFPELVLIWNRLGGARGLPVVTRMNTSRSRHLKAALTEEADLSVWERAMTAIVEDPFCSGKNDRGWRATFDYAIRPEKRGKWLDIGRSRIRPNGALLETVEERDRREAASAKQRTENTRRLYERGILKGIAP